MSTKIMIRRTIKTMIELDSESYPGMTEEQILECEFGKSPSDIIDDVIGAPHEVVASTWISFTGPDGSLRAYSHG